MKIFEVKMEVTKVFTAHIKAHNQSECNELALSGYIKPFEELEHTPRIINTKELSGIEDDV